MKNSKVFSVVWVRLTGRRSVSVRDPGLESASQLSTKTANTSQICMNNIANKMASGYIITEEIRVGVMALSAIFTQQSSWFYCDLPQSHCNHNKHHQDH